jgi:hypothetical protein
MNAISHSSRKGALRTALLPLAVVLASYGQNTQINLATQGKNVDFTSAPFTRPVKTGTALPGTCSPGDLFFKTNAAAGQNLYACTAVNTWVPQSASAPAGLGDPGSNGIVVRTGVNTTSAVGAPVGAIVGTSDTQTLTNKSIDAAQINAGTLSAARLPAFSGDISTSAGSSATTLATVNGSPGAYGDSTHAVQLTVDGKGRITAVSQVAISGAGGGSITAGALVSLPVACSAGTLYFATDQPAGQQLYQCDAANHFTQTLGLGASGALAVTSGLLDITSLVPLKAAANAFTGLNSFAVGQDMIEQASGTTPAATKLHIYANTDNTFHQVTPAGVDTSLGGGANTALSNLASVAINTALLPVTGVDLGSTVKPFRDLYLFGSGTFGTSGFRLTGAPTATRVLTLPDATDTLTGKATTDIFTNKTYDTSGTGNVFKVAGTTITAAQGNGAKVQLSTGTTTANNCAKFDANGNTVDAGLACGTNTSTNHFASANYTVLSTDQYITCDLAGAAANITLNLPAAPAASTGTTAGQDIVVFVRPSASRACTVNGNGKTIYSPSAGPLATSVALSTGGRYQFHYDSADATTPRWESNF